MQKLLRWAIKWLSRFSEEAQHLNVPEHLPPVDCPLLIEVDGVLIKAHRTGFIEQRDRTMEYQTPDGTLITGRFYWTYP